MQHNEEVFKTVNEEIDERADDGGDRDYLCECSDTTCTDTVRLTADQYRRIRADPNQYVVVPGHVLPEIENVVDHEGGYSVVAKK
jgi:hypothetical protein